MKSGILTIALVVLATTLLASGCSAAVATSQPATATPPSPNSSEVKAEARLEPVHYTALALNAEGSVSELLAHEGDEVQAGQVIARVQTANAQTLGTAQSAAAARLAQAYQAQRTAQTRLDDFDIPAKFSGMTAADAARTALASLNAARDAFEPYKDTSQKIERPNRYFATLPRHIVIDTGIYAGEAIEYKKRFDSAWLDYRKAVDWLDLESALESAQAQMAQAQKDHDNLQDISLAEDTAGTRAALANAELRAPFDGTLTNLDLKVGELAVSGTPVVTVADFSSWMAKTTDLTEIDVVNIKEGQPVTLTVDAIPGLTLKGYVLSIGQNYSERQGDIVYKVTVLLTDQNPAMRWGMTAQIHFTQ